MGNILNTDNKMSLDDLVTHITDNYIATLNFQDMRKLSDRKYCNKLVILTAKIINKNMKAADIEFLNKRYVNENGKQIEVTNTATEKIYYMNKDDLPKLDASNTNDNKFNMCIGIAKFYVKIAHIFSAIATTVNPTFVIEEHEEHGHEEHAEGHDAEGHDAEGHDADAEGHNEAEGHDADAEGHGVEEHGMDIPVAVPMPSVNLLKPHVGGTTENIVPIIAPHTSEPHTSEPSLKEISLEDKEHLPEDNSVKVKYTLCDQRLNALLNTHNLDILNDKAKLYSKENVIKPAVCSMNLPENKNTLEKEPGIPELYELYKDEYDYSNGTFKMSDAMRKVYEKDVNEFYKMFTGNDIVPPEIKTFSDITLRTFANSSVCKKDAANKIPEYSISVKDKLFKKYIDNLKQMKETSEENQNKLLDQLNKIFLTQTNPKTNKIEVTLQPDLNDTKLQKILEDTRNIIVELYINCEKDFYEGFQIFEAIVEAQIFETNEMRKTQSFSMSLPK